MYDVALVKGRVYFDDEFHNTNVYVKAGKIELISPLMLKADKIVDCDGDLVLPGIIDPHTHFHLRLPHITSRDDFYSGTRSAVFGGVTTIIDFLDPVDNAEDLERAFQHRLVDAADSIIDYSFHACLKNPVGNVEELVDKMEELDLKTVKIFTTYSDSNRRTYEPEIKELLTLSKERDFVVTAHIEEDDLIDLNPLFTYHDLPISRPTKSETTGALKLAEIAKSTGGHLYMVHCSSGTTVRALKKHYKDILHTNFSIESCPHYFVFDQSIYHKEDGYLFALAPPLRKIDEVKKLQDLIDDIDTIGTDHCSFNRRDKEVHLLKDMPLGIAGVESSFQVMYYLFGDKIINRMTKNVAMKHHLYPQKGVIKEGSDADLFIYHLERGKIVDHHGKTDHNLYHNFPTKGRIISTLSRGEFVLENGLLKKHHGQFIPRGVKAL